MGNFFFLNNFYCPISALDRPFPAEDRIFSADDRIFSVKDRIFSKTVYFTNQDRIFYYLIGIFLMKERLVL